VTKKRMGCFLLIGVLVLFLVSIVIGPIGQALFNLPLPEWLKVPKPHVELPAEIIVPIGHFGGQEFGITNTLLTTWLTMIVLLLIGVLVMRRSKVIPSRFQGLMESAFEWLYNFCKEVAGEKNGRKFFPLITTIVLFVLFNGWLSLLPGFGSIQAHTSEGEVALLRGANTDVNTPLALAFISFAFIWGNGIRTLGWGFFKKFFNIGRFLRGWGKIFTGKVKGGLGDLFFGFIDGAVGFIELISEFFRIISLTFRLFGNMMGGEILVFMMMFLVFVTPIIIPYGLELLFSLIQALIFGFLTLVFATIAATSHEGEGHGAHE